MRSRDHIRNPAEWGVDQFRAANQALGRAGHALSRHAPAPEVRRIELADLAPQAASERFDLSADRSFTLFPRTRLIPRD